jgi:hypothetical protein
MDSKRINSNYQGYRVSLNRVISDLNSYLEWKREEGTSKVIVAPDVVAELDRLATEKSGPATVPVTGMRNDAKTARPHTQVTQKQEVAPEPVV